MKQGRVLAGLVVTVLGVLAFWASMQMLFTDILNMDWALWTALLVIGSVGIGVGPVVAIVAYVQSRVGQQSYLRSQPQQVYSLPLRCSECGNEVRLHHLEWIGPEEARCPYCSAVIPVVRRGY